jgi:hypothetical protein
VYVRCSAALSRRCLPSAQNERAGVRCGRANESNTQRPGSRRAMKRCRPTVVAAHWSAVARQHQRILSSKGRCLGTKGHARARLPSAIPLLAFSQVLSLLLPPNQLVARTGSDSEHTGSDSSDHCHGGIVESSRWCQRRYVRTCMRKARPTVRGAAEPPTAAARKARVPCLSATLAASGDQSHAPVSAAVRLANAPDLPVPDRKRWHRALNYLLLISCERATRTPANHDGPDCTR